MGSNSSQTTGRRYLYHAPHRCQGSMWSLLDVAGVCVGRVTKERRHEGPSMAENIREAQDIAEGAIGTVRAAKLRCHVDQKDKSMYETR